MEEKNEVEAKEEKEEKEEGLGLNLDVDINKVMDMSLDQVVIPDFDTDQIDNIVETLTSQ